MFIYSSEDVERNDGLHDNFELIDDLLGKMCNTRYKKRPTCKEILIELDNSSIKLSDISQQFNDYINTIGSDDKSKYYLAQYIKYHICQK